jgi:hypothetical protein
MDGPGHDNNGRHVKQREGDFIARQGIDDAEQANRANPDRCPENGMSIFKDVKDPLYFSTPSPELHGCSQAFILALVYGQFSKGIIQ